MILIRIIQTGWSFDHPAEEVEIIETQAIAKIAYS